MQKNDEIPLIIEDYTSEGNGVGRVDGLAVFVPNTAIGDTIRCRIIKIKPHYAIGKCMEIAAPSKDRIKPDCPVFSQCGGCAFRHISYDAELAHKEKRVKEAFRRLSHMDVPLEPILGAERIDGYRNKAQYPVAVENNEVKIGFYAPRSHRVIDSCGCALQPPEFAQAAKLLKAFIKKHNVSVYDETTGRGLIRHLYLRKAFATGELMVCVVINGKDLLHGQSLLETLKDLSGFKTLLLNTNTDDTNVVLGARCKTLYGDGFITDELCGLRIKLSPLSFYQVNHEQAERLYKTAAAFAAPKPTDTLLDLYCGAGTIGLSMAGGVKQLIGVEIVPDAVRDALENAAINGIKNARFLCADAAVAAKTLEEEGTTPDTVILDPPRKGCDKELLETIAAMNPEKIVYVSCDPATLARDCAILTELGYTVKRAAPVDMFPRTPHMECVVLMSRVN